MISIWLTPVAEDTAYLQEIINELSSAYEAPIFAPHMTLYSPTNLSKEALTDIIKPIADDTEKLYVTMSGLARTNTIWKTVFIELESSPEFMQLQQAIVSSLPDPKPYSFEPHISLIYKEMTDEQKEEIIRNLTVRNSYKMDKITAMRTGPNVEEWEHLMEISLA